jgi:hypothetical protein
MDDTGRKKLNKKLQNISITKTTKKRKQTRERNMGGRP